jgi:hypothetical protein
MAVINNWLKGAGGKGKVNWFYNRNNDFPAGAAVNQQGKLSI